MSNAVFVFPDQPQHSDPAVFPPKPGLDYPAIATAAWLHANHRHVDLLEIDGRLHDGDDWFDTHASNDPLYGYSLALVGMLRASREVASKACWRHCCDCYAALTHCRDPVPAIPVAAPAHPREVWALLRGSEPLPGSWPAQLSDNYVEARLARVPAWQVDELYETLAKKQARGSP